ncbi:DNA-deoxyinosine glycosylase [Brevundimonas sp.]|uniref:DNA-deoxyinosine glycosylase n=1 Tax=Brevundimonas sp. TaxID=1871086 RepID=UPI0028971776|nr:DNA-deoxyinosine glycosylase [Brevundimonas sp.]
MTAIRRVGFAPVVDEGARLLILGSLPGDASLDAGQYYAHPRNAFWRLMEAVLGAPLAALPYEARLAALLARRVGLWDVIASAERKGSLDAAIRTPEAADLIALTHRLPDLRAIAFNGGTAARHGRRILEGATTAVLIDLPSSSPAHARAFEEKLAHWRMLEPYLG